MSSYLRLSKCTDKQTWGAGESPQRVDCRESVSAAPAFDARRRLAYVATLGGSLLAFSVKLLGSAGKTSDQSSLNLI